MKLDKGDFIGRAALAKVKEQRTGAQAGRLRDRGQAGHRGGQEPDSGRHGKTVGHVTVVGFSPTLKKAIGLGYVARERAHGSATN